MSRLLTILLAAGLLTACGEPAEPPASTSTPATPATTSSEAPAESSPAPAEEAAPASTAAAEEEELQYDPIDVSTLDNSWWQQYSSGS
ncbi:MAG: hypothetical protein RLW61_21675 [Gammaproteobacteria bacterium]